MAGARAPSPVTAGYVALPVDGPRTAAERLGSLQPSDPSDLALAMLTRLKVRRVAELVGDVESRDLCPMGEAEWDVLSAAAGELDPVSIGSVLSNS